MDHFLEQGKIHQFLKNLVQENALDLSSEENKKCFIYLNFLLEIYQIQSISNNLYELAQQKKIPFEFMKKIGGLFYEPTVIKGSKKLIQTKVLQQKMLMHIVLLFLRICGNKGEVELLLPHTRMGKKDFIALLRECGCSVKKEGERFRFSLKRIKLT